MAFRKCSGTDMELTPVEKACQVCVSQSKYAVSVLFIYLFVREGKIVFRFFGYFKTLLIANTFIIFERTPRESSQTNFCGLFSSNNVSVHICIRTADTEKHCSQNNS